MTTAVTNNIQNAVPTPQGRNVLVSAVVGGQTLTSAIIKNFMVALFFALIFLPTVAQIKITTEQKEKWYAAKKEEFKNIETEIAQFDENSLSAIWDKNWKGNYFFKEANGDIDILNIEEEKELIIDGEKFKYLTGFLSVYVSATKKFDSYFINGFNIPGTNYANFYFVQGETGKGKYIDLSSANGEKELFALVIENGEINTKWGMLQPSQKNKTQKICFKKYDLTEISNEGSESYYYCPNQSKCQKGLGKTYGVPGNCPYCKTKLEQP